MNLDDLKKQHGTSFHSENQRHPLHPGSPPDRRYPVQDNSLPVGYLVKGYFDDNKNVLPDVIISWPEEIAQKLALNDMKPSQLRKFFDEVRRLEIQLAAGRSFESVQGRLLMLIPYAVDAVKKGKAPPLFRSFIEQNLKLASLNSKNFLEGFVMHFESVVCYFPRNKD